MHKLERKLVSALESEGSARLNRVGSLAEISRAKDNLSSSLLSPEWIRLLLQYSLEGDGPEITVAEGLAADFVESLVDEIAIADTLQVLAEHATLSKELKGRCFESFLATTRNRARSPVARAFGLSGALQLCGTRPNYRYELLAILTDLDETDDSEYLRHASRIAGVAYTFWRADGLKESLQRLLPVDEARAEAAYELGVAAVLDGLASDHPAAALCLFRHAVRWFNTVLEVDSNRPDARLYGIALEALISFSTGGSTDTISIVDLAEEIDRLVTGLAAWHEVDESHAWSKARFAEWAAWQTLVLRLSGLGPSLKEDAWYEPARVIEEEFLGALTASRSVSFGGSGASLENLLVPQLDAALLRNKAQLSAITEWLKRNPSHPGYQDILRLKRWGERDLLGAQEKVDPSEAVPEYLSGTANQIGASQLTSSIPAPLANAISDLIEIQGAISSPFVPLLLERCERTFDNLPDFSGEGKKFFLPVYLLCLRFLISRMDLTRANTPAVAYLFESSDGSAPKEARLQEDLHQFLIGSLGTSVVVEKMDVAGGRADVCLFHMGMRLIIEVKREDRDISFESLSHSYSAQSTEYQNTNLRLGFLAVLDLSQKPSGSKHVSELVHEEIVLRPGERTPRGLVILRIPGNRKVPSGLGYR